MRTKIALIEAIIENASEGLKTYSQCMNNPAVDPLIDQSIEVDRLVCYLQENIDSLIPKQELEGELLEQFRALKEVNILDHEPEISDIIQEWDYNEMAYDLYDRLLVSCRWQIIKTLQKRLDKIGRMLDYETAIRFIDLVRLRCKQEYYDWYSAYQPLFLPANPEEYYRSHR